MRKSIFLAAALVCGMAAANAQNYENGHEYVDLGLLSGLKWATMNVGATAPEAYGDYYAWGETETKETYSWATYKHGSAAKQLTKYCTDASYGLDGFTDGKTTLDPEDDAAAVNWGGKWRMPTDAEWEELMTNCTWTWVEGYNGTDKNGYEVTSKTNGNSIFLPAAGCRGSDDPGSAGGSGYYWSGSLNTGYPLIAWYVGFGSVGVYRSGSRRCNGQSVRPVCQVTTPTALAAAEVPAVYATDGRIICDQEFRVFDLLGRDVTKMNGHLNGVYVVKCGEKAVKIVAR